MEKEQLEKILTDFAEYAHTRYLGCELIGGDKYSYGYDTEVVCMIDDYLKQLPSNQANKPK